MAASLTGVVRRPSNGTLCSWRTAQPIADSVRQAEAAGITVYVIGDRSHLLGNGGHTPWRRTMEGQVTPYGVVTACDIMCHNPAAMERAVLKLMRSPGYDTTWVAYININGSQYDFDGRFQGDSGDHHLHLECLGNRTNHKGARFIADAIALTRGKPLATAVKPKPKPKPKPRPEPAPDIDDSEDIPVMIQVAQTRPVYRLFNGTRIHINRTERDELIKAGFKIKVLPAETTDAFLYKYFGPLAAPAQVEEAK